MVYKDKELQIKYQHEWYLRKKAGIETRLTKKCTNEERKHIKHKNQLKYSQKCSQNKKIIIDEMFGTKCFFCDDKVKVIHRKDGKPHKKLNSMSLEELRNINKNDYVRVCRLCHRGVHWVMKYLNLNWEQIISLKICK